MTITAVIISRNDNYGGHLNHRSALCLINFIERYDEVIYVDWNSENRSLLEEIRSLVPKKGKLKHIVVTKQMIESFGLGLSNIQIVEVLARNIGIRLATSDFIVSTNIDIIADRPNLTSLDYDTLYVAPRRDVEPHEFLRVQNHKDFGDYLITNFQNYLAKPDANRIPEDVGDPWSTVVCCGDYQLAHKNLWYKMKGFEESMIYRNFADSNLMKKGAMCGVISKLDLPVFHMNHYGHGDGSGGVTSSNDKYKYIQNFQQTENSENWGKVEYLFDIEQI